MQSFSKLSRLSKNIYFLHQLFIGQKCRTFMMPGVARQQCYCLHISRKYKPLFFCLVLLFQQTSKWCLINTMPPTLKLAQLLLWNGARMRVGQHMNQVALKMHCLYQGGMLNYNYLTFLNYFDHYAENQIMFF